MAEYVIDEADRQALMRQMTGYRSLIGWAEEVGLLFAEEDEQRALVKARVSVHKAALAGVTSINMRQIEDAEPKVLPDMPGLSDFVPPESAAAPSVPEGTAPPEPEIVRSN